ncbi:MAG: hypothetical protein AVO38_07245 [delta proteobacterium ML8_D]|nr:MAG: hypothetical protein AVO38_07245 [delta proteobacterium ML8_D]
MVRIFIIISLVSISAGISFGTEFTQRFNAKEGFTLKLPDKWAQIPGKVLNEHSRRLQQSAPDEERPAYDYGFQLFSSGHWLEYPRILIHINSTGRIPEGKIRKLAREKDGSQPIKEKISGILNTEVKDILYDPNDHTLWMTFLSTEEGVQGLVATKLTQEGCIQIVCYSHDQDFHKYRGLFENIVRSIDLNRDLKYKSRITDSIPIISQIDLRQFFSHVFTSALVIGAIWLLLIRIKKR